LYTYYLYKTLNPGKAVHNLEVIHSNILQKPKNPQKQAFTGMPGKNAEPGMPCEAPEGTAKATTRPLDRKPGLSAEIDAGGLLRAFRSLQCT
jgi:hypothetical protein